MIVHKITGFAALLVLLVVGVLFTLGNSPLRAATPTPDTEIVMESDQLDLFAGGTGSAIIDTIPAWDPVKMPRLTWFVEDLPPALTSEFWPSARPDSGLLILHAASSAPPGEYTVRLTAQTTGSVWTARLVVRVAPCQPYYATGELVTGEVKFSRAGGPSTARYGTVWPLLRFCASESGHTMHITVTEVITEQGNHRAGTHVPVELYEYLVGEPENASIAVQPSLLPTARKVTSGQNGTLAWSIEPGAYVLYFPQHALVDTLSTMGRSFPNVVVRFELEME
ncbi:MAG TPA: hypothetical protein VHP83_16040 [Aggregatilineaceae bacterium]|nr:hypothetical protein [Aggregatilineaceae bacterium]